MMTTISSRSNKQNHTENKKSIDQYSKFERDMCWDDTTLRDICRSKLTTQDIKNLLRNRGETRSTILKQRKSVLINLLKSNYSVKIEQRKLEQLTGDHAYAELKLHGLDLKSHSTISGFLLKQHLKNRWNVSSHKWKIDGKPLMINHTEYLVIKNAQLYQYNVTKNQCIKRMDIPGNQEINTQSTCINCTGKEIYVINTDNNTLLIIDYFKKQIEIVQLKLEILDWPIPKLIFINGELHLIAVFECSGNKTLQHRIFDKESKTFKQFHVFSHGWKSWNLFFMKFELLYVPSKQEMLLIIGFNGQIIIFSYFCKTRKWSIKPQILAIVSEWSLIRCILTRDENVLILNAKDEKIYIIDMDKMKFQTSCIYCPGCSFDPMLVENQQTNELLAFGFIRNSWNKCGMEMDRFPPQYLIRLIQKWVSNEYLQLMISQCDQQFCVSINEIME